MAFKYFPENESTQEFLLQIYSMDMKVKAYWVQEAFEEYEEMVFSGEPFKVLKAFRKATEVINNAMAIVRMYEEAGLVKDPVIRERMLERVVLINNRWQLPRPPQKLRNMRNKLEHLEQKLDEWVTDSENHNIADFNYGPVFMEGSQKNNFRRLEGENLYFWGQAVNLREVYEWAIKITESLESN